MKKFITFLVICAAVSALPAQEVKPAFPDGKPPTPNIHKVLRVRYFLGDDVVGSCDATSTPFEHINCRVEQGHTLDEFLDALVLSEQLPCTDQRNRNDNTGWKKPKRGRESL